MRRHYFYRRIDAAKDMNNVFMTSENWESDIREVQIELDKDDPTGFSAVFFLQQASERARAVTFRIGASALANRARSLAQAGFKAPMTCRAIALVESRKDAGVTA